MPALLVVSLLIGVTVSAIKPGVRALHRDASAELLATRQIAQTLVRAVRGLAASDVHRPAVLRPRPVTAPVAASHSGVETFRQDSVRSVLLRESLLALPPPNA